MSSCRESGVLVLSNIYTASKKRFMGAISTSHKRHPVPSFGRPTAREQHQTGLMYKASELDLPSATCATLTAAVSHEKQRQIKRATSHGAENVAPKKPRTESHVDPEEQARSRNSRADSEPPAQRPVPLRGETTTDSQNTQDPAQRPRTVSGNVDVRGGEKEKGEEGVDVEVDQLESDGDEQEQPLPPVEVNGDMTLRMSV